MRYHDKDGWKNKIDPAFDKPIKTYIKYLSQIENLPDDGHITFKDDFIELINKNPDFSASYNHEFKEEILYFNKNIGLLDNQESALFLEILYSLAHANSFSTLKSQMHSLIKLAEKLPEEESRKFYLNKIRGFLNDPCNKPFFEFQKDFLSITLSLFIRLVFVKLDEDDKTEPTKEQIAHLKNPIVINQLIGFIFSTISQIAHQRETRELLNNISKGDDKSLFKVIVIDKGLINYKPIAKRINKAKISGDKEFTKEIFLSFINRDT